MDLKGFRLHDHADEFSFIIRDLGGRSFKQYDRMQAKVYCITNPVVV